MTENDYTHPWKYPDFLDALPIIIHGAVGPLKKIYLTRTYVYIIYSYVYVVYIWYMIYGIWYMVYDTVQDGQLEYGNSRLGYLINSQKKTR